MRRGRLSALAVGALIVGIGALAGVGLGESAHARDGCGGRAAAPPPLDPRHHVAGVQADLRDHRRARQARAEHGHAVRAQGRAPRGGWPVLSWAHGTSGLGDRCAPSVVGPALPDATAPTWRTGCGRATRSWPATTRAWARRASPPTSTAAPRRTTSWTSSRRVAPTRARACRRRAGWRAGGS